MISCSNTDEQYWLNTCENSARNVMMIARYRCSLAAIDLNFFLNVFHFFFVLRRRLILNLFLNFCHVFLFLDFKIIFQKNFPSNNLNTFLECQQLLIVWNLQGL
jgi:hypothetical protein